MAAGGSRDPRIGTFLKDKWRVDARLGRGGVATVYAATHRNGNRVAIKMLNREVARVPDIRSRFLREGYTANAVSHPGVVRVLDDDTSDEGQPFLVMDLLEGELVDERRNRKGGRLPLIEVLRIGDQVLDVLASAHEKGIIHRDIKPENIFLCSDGDVKVLDFGIARMRQAAAGEMTATGMLLGTPEFMSPEQANGIQEDVDQLTDIWATGATLFTLLSGESVHEAATTTAQILATVTTPARSLATVAGDVPRSIIDVIDRALAYNKRERWPDARAMQRALADAGRGIGTGSSSYAGLLRRGGAVIDRSDAQGPVSEEEATIARPAPEVAIPSSDGEAVTNPKPPVRTQIIEDEATTVAERGPPVSPPTRVNAKTQRSEHLGPVSEDFPTFPTGVVPPRPPPEEAPTRVSARPPELAATQTSPRTDGGQPTPPTRVSNRPIPAHPIKDGHSAQSGATAVMPAPPVDLKATKHMPVPQSMGGFIINKRPAQSETPTAPARSRGGASGKGWTTLAIAVGVGVLVLWVVLVIVLRALFR